MQGISTLNDSHSLNPLSPLPFSPLGKGAVKTQKYGCVGMAMWEIFASNDEGKLNLK